MKQKPRFTLELLTAAFGLLWLAFAVLLVVTQPALWPVAVAALVLCTAFVFLFRYQLGGQFAPQPRQADLLSHLFQNLSGFWHDDHRSFAHIPSPHFSF